MAIPEVAISAEAASSGGSLVRHLPAGALGTVEVAGLAPIIDKIEKSEALKQYLDSPLYDDALKLDPVQKALAGKAIAEAQLGMSLWQAAKTYLGDRIALGVYVPSDGKQPDGVMIVQVKDAGDLTKLIEKTMPMIALTGSLVSSGDYEGGGKQFKFKDGSEAVVRDRWLVASKNRDLLSQTLSNLTSSKDSGLMSEAAWKTMARQMGERHEIQVCVNLAKIAELQGGKRLIPAKLDNPVVSLLYGGLVELANSSPYVGTTLDLRDDGFSLQSAVAGKASDVDEAHRAMLVNPDKPLVPFVPNVPGRLGAISLSRDFVTWYKAREKLLEAKLLPEFDKFETGIATFLPGKDFAEDVLPVLTGRMAFISAPQDFSNLDGKPGVQLPAFGLVVELAKPQEGADLFNVVTQTLLAIVNINAGQEKRQPWVQTSESYHNVQINFARFLQRPKGDQLPTAYNFQPASALVGNRFIFSSTLGMCRQLVDALTGEAASAKPASATGAVLPNFVQELNPSVGADLLEANAAVIHAKSIQGGKTAEQSARELDGLCKLLRHLTPIKFDTVQYPDHMRLELHGGWK
ncbi:MAG: hypothetical protein H7062_23505 [Candidatus Saccharimonas sp.]|nr:hypothetical protein [Planctomycetaceae bacterium]